jgi:hypothetical protein
MASPTQMHNVLCRSVTIEARFTASSRSSGSHRNWTDLYMASNSRVRGALWKALYVQDVHSGTRGNTSNTEVAHRSDSHSPIRLGQVRWSFVNVRKAFGSFHRVRDCSDYRLDRIEGAAIADPETGSSPGDLLHLTCCNAFWSSATCSSQKDFNAIYRGIGEILLSWMI